MTVTARPPAGPPFSAFRTAVGAVGSLLADHPWMGEEIMKPLLQFSSLRVGHSSGLSVLDPSDTLLDRRTTPRPRRSITPSAWWSTLRNWTGGFTHMMIKLQDLDCYFFQALAVRSGGWHDCHKPAARGSMAWLPRAAAVIPRRTATAVSWMLDAHFHRVPAEIGDGERQ